MKFKLLLLILPLIIGIIIRLIGIKHGYPNYIYHPDVSKQAIIAETTYKNHKNTSKIIFDTNSELTLYPYGDSIIISKVMNIISDITGNKKFDTVPRWNWALYMRYLSIAIFMLAALFVAWFLFKKTALFPTFLALLLLISEPINSQYSHYAMNDVPLTAMLIISWILAALMEKEKTSIPVFSLLCGLSLGLAFDIKYQAVIGGIFPLISWIALYKTKGRNWLFSSIAVIVIGGIAGILYLNPLLRHEPAYFFKTFPEFMKWQSNIMGYKIPYSTKIPQNIILLIRHLQIPGIVLLLTGPVLSLILIFRRKMHDKNVIPAISASLFCIMLIGIFIISRDFIRNNDIIPILSFSSLLTAFTLWQVTVKTVSTRKQKILSFLFYVMIIIINISFLATSLADSIALTGQDTRQQAQQWCFNNLPINASVMRERYTIKINRTDIQECRKRYIKPDFINYDYVIISSMAYSRFFDKHSPYYCPAAQERYITLENNWYKAKTFKKRELYFANPTITIYKNPKVKVINPETTTRMIK